MYKSREEPLREKKTGKEGQGPPHAVSGERKNHTGKKVFLISINPVTTFILTGFPNVYGRSPSNPETLLPRLPSDAYQADNVGGLVSSGKQVSP